MVQIHDLKFQYTKSQGLILDVPRLEIKQGEKIFIYGPSGCGKTTFLETLAGINVPQSGVLKIRDQDLTQMTISERDRFRSDHLGYIFQSFNLIPYLNVLENITLPLYLSSKKRQKVSRDLEIKAAMSMCQTLGLEPFLSKSVTELSVGQQQRVAAARALLGSPELLLADEPTSSLDYDHRERFIRLLFDLCTKQNTTLLFVSHDQSLARLFDRSLNLVEINKANPLDIPVSP